MGTPVMYYKCLFCPFKTTLNFRMDSHEIIHNFTKVQTLFDCSEAIDSLKCYQCTSFETSKLVDLKQHLKTNHRLRNSDNYGKPVINFRKKKLYNCQHCTYSSNRKEILETHSVVKHTDPDKIRWFKCGLCQYKSVTKYNLWSHLKNMHGSNIFKCSYCPLEVKCKRYLQKHISAKHSNRTKLKCHHCPYESMQKFALESHILFRHTDSDKINWFECQLCSYKAKIKYHLKLHMRRKHGN